MTLFERSSLEERLQTEREIEADESARFIYGLATIGQPIPLAGIVAASEVAHAARRSSPVARMDLADPSLVVTTPVGPCAPAV